MSLRSSGTTCAVSGCTYNQAKLSAWLNKECYEHKPAKKSECTCRRWFAFYSLPKDEDDKQIWLQNLNLKNPPTRLYVCSFHFVDNKPTYKNPYPTKWLGNDQPPEKKPRIQQRRITDESEEGGATGIQNTDVALPVTCGEKQGALDIERLSQGTACIEANGFLFSPPDFERWAGRGPSRNWKRTIYYGNMPLNELFIKGILKTSGYYKNPGGKMPFLQGLKTESQGVGHEDDGDSPDWHPHQAFQTVTVKQEEDEVLGHDNTGCDQGRVNMACERPTDGRIVLSSSGALCQNRYLQIPITRLPLVKVAGGTFTVKCENPDPVADHLCIRVDAEENEPAEDLGGTKALVNSTVNEDAPSDVGHYIYSLAGDAGTPSPAPTPITMTTDDLCIRGDEEKNESAEDLDGSKASLVNSIVKEEDTPSDIGHHIQSLAGDAGTPSPSPSPITTMTVNEKAKLGEETRWWTTNVEDQQSGEEGGGHLAPLEPPITGTQKNHRAQSSHPDPTRPATYGQAGSPHVTKIKLGTLNRRRALRTPLYRGCCCHRGKARERRRERRERALIKSQCELSSKLDTLLELLTLRMGGSSVGPMSGVGDV